MKIEPLRQTIGAAKITLSTSDGRDFFLLVDKDGLSFFSEENSAGTLLGKPIKKSADQILRWIADEGDKKKFKDRKGVQPRRTKPQGS